MNMNRTQESKLLDNRWPTLLPRNKWCFATKHWNMKPHIFCMNFMKGFVHAILRDKSQQKRFCRLVITNPRSSKMPMIIVGVVMYVKLMHKCLLWVAFYTLYHL
jgi:hypothetical protein